MYPHSMFWAKIRNYHFLSKFFIFTAVKNHCILHGHVFVIKCVKENTVFSYFLCHTNLVNDLVSF